MEDQQIRKLNNDDKPREKLEKNGASSLSDAELLAILLRTGTTKKNAITLARELLSEHQYNWAELSRKSIPDLIKTKGIGKVKAITLSAALEIGKRRREEEARTKSQIKSSRDAFELFRTDLEDLNHEEFHVICLNRANKLIKKIKLSKGGMSGTVVDPKLIFKMAIEMQAHGIIVAHNHPSESPFPSDEDKKITSKLKEAGKMLELNLIDHIIIAGSNYFSFADEGLI
ncbi:MAG TPA: DNA repair protein RadC [Bacteroidia bacterium]|nr:DNA repair protein RadC [Bacteroidia bacterium]HNT79178.1 DNA repair protein RadC [Bacteroidia bacterium]